VNQNLSNAYSAGDHDKPNDCYPGPSKIPAPSGRRCPNFVSMRRKVITDGLKEF
jgi:hypothetical protein